MNFKKIMKSTGDGDYQMRGSNIFMQDKVKKSEKDYNKKIQKDITVEDNKIHQHSQARLEADSQQHLELRAHGSPEQFQARRQSNAKSSIVRAKKLKSKEESHF
jgi:hypothetical protein